MENKKLYLLPSAYIPFALSLASLALVLGHVALYGTARQADEGAAAHLFQLFMVVQLPIAAYFAIKWLPRKTVQALLVLGLQALAYFAAFGALYWYEVLSQVH